ESEELLLANRAILAEQTRLEKETAEKSSRYREIEDKYNKAAADYSRARKAYKVSSGQVRELKESINRRRLELDSLKKQNALSERQIREKESQLEKSESELREMEARLEEDSKALQELSAAVTEQQRLKDAAKAELDKANGDLALVKDDLKKANRDLDVAREALKEYANLRLGTVVVRQEDEIARGVVDGSRTIPEISASLMQLLANANEICYNILSIYKDEPISAEGEKAAAGFKNAYVRLVFRDEAGDIYEDNIRVMVMSAAEAIKTKGGDSLITVSSAGNLTADELEVIPVEFRLHEEKLVFTKDSLIADIRFTGRESDAELFTLLYDFYTNTVFNRSVNKGSVPAQMSPLFAYYCQKAMERNPALRLFSSYKETSLKEQVEVILEQMKEIKACGNGSHARLYATRDLYSSDVVSNKNTRMEVS
ncbi:MAG: hypothetical protein IJT95_01465, partial [Abditibacteriota bacterium]|nr:hypothetical protein [Abditibacteriota bacterium]